MKHCYRPIVVCSVLASLWAGHRAHGQLIETKLLKGHKGCLERVAIAPKGTWGASVGAPADGGQKEVIFLWRLPNGEFVRKLVGPKDQWVQCIVYSPDESVLAVSYGTVVYQWSLTEFGTFKEFQFPERVTAMAYSPNGKSLAVALKDKGIVLLDPKTLAQKGEISRERDFRDSIGILSFSEDSQWLAAGLGNALDDNRIAAWKVGVSKPQFIERVPGLTVLALEFVKGGRQLGSAGIDGKFHLLDVATGNVVWSRVEGEEEWPIWSMSYCSKKKILVYGTQGGDIRFIDVTKSSLMKTLNFGYAVRSVSISPEGDFLMVGFGDMFATPDDPANRGRLAIVKLLEPDD